ncbi:MAG TPA: hypothetical protein VF952_01445 [Chloroflexia bacterium]|jgi:hypothetical protein
MAQLTTREQGSGLLTYIGSLRPPGILATLRAESASAREIKLDAGQWIGLVFSGASAIGAILLIVITNGTRFNTDIWFFLSTIWVVSFVLLLLLVPAFYFAGTSGPGGIMLIYLARKTASKPLEFADEILLIRSALPPPDLTGEQLRGFVMRQKLVNAIFALFVYGTLYWYVSSVFWVAQRGLHEWFPENLVSELDIFLSLGPIFVGAICFVLLVGHIRFAASFLREAARLYPKSLL